MTETDVPTPEKQIERCQMLLSRNLPPLLRDDILQKIASLQEMLEHLDI
jgi:hypothetical protein